MKKGGRKSKNIIDLRGGACAKMKGPMEEAICLEKRIKHREQVRRNIHKGKKMGEGTRQKRGK